MTRDTYMGSRSYRSMATLAIGALVAGLLVGAPAGATPAKQTAAADSRDGDVVRHSVAPAAVGDARAVREFWTPERMAAAKPLDIAAPVTDPATEAITEAAGAGGIITQPYESVEPDAVAGLSARKRSKAPRTAGKLFFTDSALTQFVCSAAAINTKDKNMVLTAGHCVNAGDGRGWFGNFVFVPRFHRGNSPDGKWVGKTAWAFRGWTQQGKFGYDQALIAFKKRKGRKLVKVVGGNGVAWGRGVKQRGVHVWGWPAEPPYTGNVAKRCEGKTSRFRKSGDAKIRCKMNGGASGGPWLLKKRRKANVGYIWAVTSRRTTKGTKYLLARPNSKALKRMIRKAN